MAGRKRLIVGGVGLALLAALGLGTPVEAPAQASNACPRHGALFEPPDGKTLLIVGQDRDSTEAYVAATGLVPGGFMAYSSVAAPVAGLHHPLNFGGTSHAQHFVDKYPHSAMQIGLTMNPLEATSLGAYDDGIAILADWVKAANRPVFIRLGYEFDAEAQDNDPVQYVAAWRHVVDELRGHGVTNAAFVWHSVGWATAGGRPLEAWYPGDDYVDWTAVSIYGQGFSREAFVYIHRMADFADAHGKPLMIAESTPRGRRAPTSDGDELWNAWYANVIDFINERGVKAWSYVNQDWDNVYGAGWGDSRVQTNPVLQARWMAEVTQDKYLNASTTLYCDHLGYGMRATPPAPTVAAPLVEPGSPAEGSPVNVSATFSPADAASCTIDHGDGTPVQAGSVEGNRCLGPNHVYEDDGEFLVHVDVTNAGGSGSASASHSVVNAAPVVENMSVRADRARRATAQARFSDAGTRDAPFACTVDYGDGAGPTLGTISGDTCTGPEHRYTGIPAVHRVTVAVTDKDGATGTASATA